MMMQRSAELLLHSAASILASNERRSQMGTSAYLPAVSALTLAAVMAPTCFAQTQADLCYPSSTMCRNVKVTVQGSQVTVEPATVTFSGLGGPRVIVWYLDTPGYKFAAPPVAFPPEPWITRYQFEPDNVRACYWWKSGTTYVCHDRNYATLDVTYAIKVEALSGGSPATGSAKVVNN
jgi:hypothetical protein